MVHALRAIERTRPRLVVGEDQGGVVAAMMTFPLVLEKAVREGPFSEGELKAWREAWGGIEAILVVDPLVTAQTKTVSGISFPCL